MATSEGLMLFAAMDGVTHTPWEAPGPAQTTF